MYDINELNEIQKKAVLDTEGAVLVTAGAGSGKTRLLTHRIAHLIKDLGVKPYNILAITFTNKAANEMKSRLSAMLGDVDDIWISTFHSACVKILRRYIDKIGYSKNFTIYGETETKAIVKRICKDNDFDDKMLKRIISGISNAKNSGITPDRYEVVYRFRDYCEVIAMVYELYEKELKKNNALDYDDLLLLTLKLLRTDEEARLYYANKFRYIHIDEFQDTNAIQYDIAKILASVHGNIFVVGDEDQCIYTWRGASIANIFDFQRDFNCKLYKLEQNYRSTSNILSIANKIIKGNKQRLDKKLWTANGEGEKVICQALPAEGFEADYVVRTIFEQTHDGNYNYSDYAVLFRLNSLSRLFEERLNQCGIPYRVYGGFKFFDRKEIKDVLAYARLSVNQSDDEALFRIINFPKRQIGEASCEKLRNYSKDSGISVCEAVLNADNLPAIFNSSLKAKLKDFGDTIKSLIKAAEGDIISYFKFLLYNVLDIENVFSDDDEDRLRLDNIYELNKAIKDFSRLNKGATVADYLHNVSLSSDTDNMNNDNVITLATVHSAKGLEFPIVFVVGCEDGIFPLIREDENDKNHIEEERRLMYVAVTRAKRMLFLTLSNSRFLRGEKQYPKASRFLSECELVGRPTEYKSQAASGAQDNTANSYSSFDGKFVATYKSDYGKVADKPKPTSDNNNLTVGCFVMHKRFGKGKVIEIEKLGDNVYAVIDFGKNGAMRLAVGFAPLTVVEE
ncbi:MAG: UvrD-helicase domain-containing protein [Clostridiales bacterium]|nr:UvrD-helicase domain-containing protein [Clostridiales bacterium]